MSMVCSQATILAANPANQGTVLTVDTSLNIEPQNSDDEDNQATGAVEVPEPAWVWHPISVVNEPINGFNAIRRTYALPPDVNPAVIPIEDFEMFGQKFSYAYVLQQSTSNESYIEMRETVTIEASSRNLNDILPKELSVNKMII